MADSVATFTDQMVKLKYSIDDREIYNDIRSQIDVSETDIVQESGPEYDTGIRTGFYSVAISPGGTFSRPFDAPSGRSVTWLSCRCYSAGADIYGRSESYCDSVGGNFISPWGFDSTKCAVDVTSQVAVTFTKREPNTCTVKATNNSSVEIDSIGLTAVYSYLSRPEVVNEVTTVRSMTVRAIDETSIAKYGRRVMNLIWPLGQSQVQMQAIADNYRDRLKEPQPYAKMVVLGTDDFLVTQIFNRKISDKITVINSRLGLNAEFFINSVKIAHRVDGLLQATWMIEQLRTLAGGGGAPPSPAPEDVDYFVIDTSELDGPHILAP